MSEHFDEIAPAIEPDAASRSFEALQPLLAAQTELRAANVAKDRAVLVAASVGRMVRRPEVRARFAGLSARDFDTAHVDRLEPAALAMWYASVSLASAKAQPRDRVPAGVHARAVAVKQRMHKVATYHLGDDPEISMQLADIGAGPGNGYLPLAEALLSLARLYERHADRLAGDLCHYRPDDRILAGQLGHAIHRLLGERDAVTIWTEHGARAWSFLVATYEEVRAAGRWLFRHENGDALFPSLYTAGRGPRRRRTRAALQAARRAKAA